MNQREPMPIFRAAVFALAAIVTVAPLFGASVDKRNYSWANPTPASELREMATDRPDATESPFTVDAGHIQLELDLVTTTRNRLDGVRTVDWGVAPFNIRVGIRHDFELGVFVAPFDQSTEQDRSGPKTTVRGLGDTVLRAKWNFLGNDGGTAVGLITDCKIPTAARGLGNDKVEASFTVPVALELEGGWSFGAMSGIGAVHDGSRYRAVFANTATLGHDLTENVGGYLELTSESGIGAHVCTFNVGLGWRLDSNRQLDGGVNLGASRSAPDITVFTGYSQRF